MKEPLVRNNKLLRIKAHPWNRVCTPSVPRLFLPKGESRYLRLLLQSLNEFLCVAGDDDFLIGRNDPYVNL